MYTSIPFPLTMSDVLIDSGSDLFSRKTIYPVNLPADCFVGDILNSVTNAHWSTSDTEGIPYICLQDRSAGTGKSLIVVDRLAVINAFNVRAKDGASTTEALKRLLADGSIRAAVNTVEQ